MMDPVVKKHSRKERLVTFLAAKEKAGLNVFSVGGRVTYSLEATASDGNGQRELNKIAAWWLR
ncbi:hypothetical protein OUZ56_026825 [Daphnia magna]|uniref:Uncharacterized protein n=1 Tax=Daphnia magna TaxID=35525 RepID=A0ABQ9ZMX6_9CRUS|nr:hypothetical protein OUZ56_026825 [Daphnia magna]